MIDIHKNFIEVRQYFHKHLPHHLTYHNWAHTLSVYRNVQHIGRREHLNEKEIKRLRIAALFHDIAYLESSFEHEKRGCEIMENWLENYDVSNQDIQAMSGMIMATKIPQKPKNHLEKVLADADLLYLGTNKYEKISSQLYEEFHFLNPKLDQSKWKQLQIDFLSTHTFHTAFCKRHYEWKKQKNLNHILKELLVEKRNT